MSNAPDVFYDPKRNYHVLRCATCRAVLHRNKPTTKPHEAIVTIENGSDAIWLFCNQRCADISLKVFGDPEATMQSHDVKKLLARAYPLRLKSMIGQKLFRGNTK